MEEEFEEGLLVVLEVFWQHAAEGLAGVEEVPAGEAMDFVVGGVAEALVLVNAVEFPEIGTWTVHGVESCVWWECGFGAGASGHGGIVRFANDSMVV